MAILRGQRGRNSGHVLPSRPITYPIPLPLPLPQRRLGPSRGTLLAGAARCCSALGDTLLTLVPHSRVHTALSVGIVSTSARPPAPSLNDHEAGRHTGETQQQCLEGAAHRMSDDRARLSRRRQFDDEHYRLNSQRRRKRHPQDAPEEIRQFAGNDARAFDITGRNQRG